MIELISILFGGPSLRSQKALCTTQNISSVRLGTHEQFLFRIFSEFIIVSTEPEIALKDISWDLSKGLSNNTSVYPKVQPSLGAIL